MGKPDDDTIEGIPKRKLELKGAKPGNTMVLNFKIYCCCPNYHGGGIWVSHKRDKYNLKKTKVEANASE